MARPILTCTGFFAFAAIAGFHYWSLWHVAAYHAPAAAVVVAVLLALVWLGWLGLILKALQTAKLKGVLLAVFVYVMAMTFVGMSVLEGVPSEVGKEEWYDPDHRLTPDARYLLHNHSRVVRVLSEAEYRLYSNYGACYFSAGLMLFAAALCLHRREHPQRAAKAA
jgi:hypothetical protein